MWRGNRCTIMMPRRRELKNIESANIATLWRSSTSSRLARSTSFSIARWVSRASVGCAIAFSCTVVSTTTRSSLDRPAPVRHREALLQQRGDLLLTQPLAPAGQRRAVERHLVPEHRFAAETSIEPVVAGRRLEPRFNTANKIADRDLSANVMGELVSLTPDVRSGQL